MSSTLSARDALDRLSEQASPVTGQWPVPLYDLLDVRSEGEFAAASIPGFHNTPILLNQERHEVGLCYKHKGQAAAIALGEALVGPVQAARVQDWLSHTRPEATLIVTCWRGGLRSQIATQWLEEAGRDVRRVIGGYKALRHELLNILTRPHEFFVLSGLTGAGKTRLLETLPSLNKLDIEAHATHRGSSFGRHMNRPQPTQATFENRLALALRQTHGRVLVEDESKVIGSLHLPEPIYTAMTESPLVILESSLAERSRNIYDEYIGSVLATDVDPQTLKANAIASTLKLQRRLGGLLTSQVLRAQEAAFASAEPEAHMRWIELLLSEYYDNRYRYSQVHSSRPLAFRGTYEECQQWISHQYA